MVGCDRNARFTALSIGSTWPCTVLPSIAKNKIELSDKGLIDRILEEMKKEYAAEEINDIDGVKISFESKRQWVHLRRSNTEPIIRIYSEAPTLAAAESLANEVIGIAERVIKDQN